VCQFPRARIIGPRISALLVALLRDPVKSHAHALRQPDVRQDPRMSCISQARDFQEYSSILWYALAMYLYPRRASVLHVSASSSHPRMRHLTPIIDAIIMPSLAAEHDRELTTDFWPRKFASFYLKRPTNVLHAMHECNSNAYMVDTSSSRI
jgi:hypothetical protein